MRQAPVTQKVGGEAIGSIPCCYFRSLAVLSNDLLSIERLSSDRMNYFRPSEANPEREERRAAAVEAGTIGWVVQIADRLTEARAADEVQRQA
jgi:hypothetical protein